MHVKALWEYPVKSLAGYSLETAVLTPRGFAHDRRWMLVDEAGLFVSQRTRPGLSRKQARLDGDILVLAGLDDGAILRIPDAKADNGPRVEVQLWQDVFEARLVSSAPAAALEDFFGFPCRLVYMAPDCQRLIDQKYAGPEEEVGFADGFPYLITNQASLDAFAAHYGAELSMLRFRPNIVTEGAHAFAEDEWTEIRTESAVFRTPKPCGRCVMITIDPDTGKKQPGVLSTLASFHTKDHKILFGVNACWTGSGAGAISVGEKLLALSS